MLVQDEVPVVGSLGDSKPWLLLFLKLSLLSKTRACCRKHSCCCSLEIFWGRKEVLPHGWVWQVLPGIRDVGSCWSWVAWWHLPRDQHHSVTSVAAWSLSFSHFYWIDKRSNELPALEDLGVCCVYFLVMFFVLFGLEAIPRTLIFPQTGIQFLWRAAVVLQPVSHTAAHSLAELLSSSESENIKA